MRSFVAISLCLPAACKNDKDDRVGPGGGGSTTEFEPLPCDSDNPPDDDQDGFPPCGDIGEADCNDHDPSVHPGAAEHCDGFDNDCDTEIDDDPVNPLDWYVDTDGDGFGDCEAEAETACAPPDDSYALSLEECDPEPVDTGEPRGPGPVESLTDIGAELAGEGGFAGNSVTSGDINGDGVADLLVGAPQAESRKGKVYLTLGPVSPDPLSEAHGFFIGEENGDAGCSVAAFDHDDDGYGDLLVGSQEFGQSKGAAYLVYGPKIGTHDLADADHRIYGELTGSDSGWVVTPLGDMNGDDNHGDFAVTAHYRASVYLFWDVLPPQMAFSDASATLVGAGGRAGWSAAGGGDANADGFADLLVGAPYMPDGDHPGEAYLVLGPVDRGEVDLSSADRKFLGENARDELGQAVGWLGDINGDGRSDFALGATFFDVDYGDEGAVYLWYGMPRVEESLADADAILKGNTHTEFAGNAISGVGDLDGDSLDDFVVGAKNWDVEKGRVYVVYEAVEGHLRLRNNAITLEATSGQTGFAISGVGDQDFDEKPEIAIGAPYAPGGGAVFIVHAADLPPYP